MDAVKCPNCGSEKVQGLTEEKYVCLACDNVFLIHNLSKEFRQTDEHISSVHQDLKEGINRLAGANQFNEYAVLEKAEGHMQQETWGDAYALYTQVAEESPQHAAGWIGRYRALTGDYTQIDRYARFVCDGNYIDLDEGEERIWFDGHLDVKRALSCGDADKEAITKEVTGFIKRCAEYGKQDIEASIRECVEGFESVKKERDHKMQMAHSGMRNEQIKVLVPSFLILGLLVLCVWYFFAAGDWLGKLIGVAGIFLVVKYGRRVVIKGIRNTKNATKGWEDAFYDVANPLIEDMDIAVGALIHYCTDLDNYNKVLQDVQDEDAYIRQFITNPAEGLSPCSKNEDRERFIFDFLAGKIERYRYLLPNNGVMQQPVGENVIQPQPVGMPAPDQAFKFCHACGTKMSADSAFCVNCGTKLG